jgi:hypothetical protein
MLSLMKISALLQVESSQQPAGKSAGEFSGLAPSGIAMVIITMAIVF